MRFLLLTTRSLNNEESCFGSVSAKRRLFFHLLSWYVYRRTRTNHLIAIRDLESSIHDGLQDADGVDAISAPGRGGGGISAADGYRSETSESVVADFCVDGAY